MISSTRYSSLIIVCVWIVYISGKQCWLNCSIGYLFEIVHSLPLKNTNASQNTDHTFFKKVFEDDYFHFVWNFLFFFEKEFNSSYHISSDILSPPFSKTSSQCIRPHIYQFSYTLRSILDIRAPIESKTAVQKIHIAWTNPKIL